MPIWIGTDNYVGFTKGGEDHKLPALWFKQLAIDYGRICVRTRRKEDSLFSDLSYGLSRLRNIESLHEFGDT